MKAVLSKRRLPFTIGYGIPRQRTCVFTLDPCQFKIWRLSFVTEVILHVIKTASQLGGVIGITVHYANGATTIKLARIIHTLLARIILYNPSLVGVSETNTSHAVGRESLPQTAITCSCL
jgi:hypothetical protein